MSSILRLLRLDFLRAGILLAGLSQSAQAVSWTSAATGGAITATVTEPNPAVSTPALIVYLKNLSCERIGQEPDASIIADFTANGYRVVVLDYAGHPNATTPFLNADVLKIRNEIGTGAFPGSTGLTATKDKCCILCEGYRLMRFIAGVYWSPLRWDSRRSSAADVRVNSCISCLDSSFGSSPSGPCSVLKETGSSVARFTFPSAPHRSPHTKCSTNSIGSLNIRSDTRRVYFERRSRSRPGPKRYCDKIKHNY
jgi:hypothetical protein